MGRRATPSGAATPARAPCEAVAGVDVAALVAMHASDAACLSAPPTPHRLQVEVVSHLSTVGGDQLASLGSDKLLRTWLMTVRIL